MLSCKVNACKSKRKLNFVPVKYDELLKTTKGFCFSSEKYSEPFGFCVDVPALRKQKGDVGDKFDFDEILS